MDETLERKPEARPQALPGGLDERDLVSVFLKQ